MLTLAEGVTPSKLTRNVSRIQKRMHLLLTAAIAGDVAVIEGMMLKAKAVVGVADGTTVGEGEGTDGNTKDNGEGRPLQFAVRPFSN